MGGARTRTLLMSGMLDELRIHLAPVLLGSGLRLFENNGVLNPGMEKV